MDQILGKHRLQHIKSVFLLVNLLVSRTLGDCPKPVLAENIILTNEALLMNDFPDDVEISLTCANGYVKDTGSGTMRCTEGTWSDLDLTCKKKDCGMPTPKPFMTFDLSEGTLFGAVATVSCEKGYLVKGSSYKHCYNAGWTGKSTECLIVTCDAPEQIANGVHSWDSDEPPKYGENIQYFCNEGYALTGKDSVMCTDDGEYDFPAPRCLGVTNEDVFTTNRVTTPTSTATPPTQETSATSTAPASSTSSGHRGSTLTASATATVSLSARGADIVLREDNSTTVLSPTVPHYSQGDQNDDTTHTKKDGYTPVIISVVCVTIAACVVVLFIHRLLHKRKGSQNETSPIY